MAKEDSKVGAMGVDAKANEAFKSAFEAMSQWRDDINESTERHGQAVFDKLSVAARTVGWPDSLIETTKSQMMQATKMQSDMIDHMMTAWQDQLKSPANPSKLMGTIAANSSGHSAQGLNPDLANLALAPTQFWMQATAMWQKSWSDAMQAWMGNRPSDDSEKSRHTRS